VTTGFKRSPLQESFDDLGREMHPAAMHRAMLVKLDCDGRTARKLRFTNDCYWPRLCGNARQLPSLLRHLGPRPYCSPIFASESLKRFYEQRFVFGNALFCAGARANSSLSRFSGQHPHQLVSAEDSHHALQVVGQHMQTHFSAHPPERFRQEVSGAHPVLERAERMLNG